MGPRERPKSLEFALASSLADLSTTALYMHRHEDAIWREGNELARKLVTRFGIERGLVLEYLSFYLPSILSACLLSKFVDKYVSKLLGKKSTYCETGVMGFMGLSSLLEGAYNWFRSYELNSSDPRFSVPFLVPYLFAAFYPFYALYKLWRDARGALDLSDGK